MVRCLADDGWAAMALDLCGGPAAVSFPMPTVDDLSAVATPYEHVVTRAVDVRDREALDMAAAEAVDLWGRLDAAVAAAGVITGGSGLWATGEDELDLLWETCAKGVWNTAVAAVPHAGRAGASGLPIRRRGLGGGQPRHVPPRRLQRRQERGRGHGPWTRRGSLGYRHFRRRCLAGRTDTAMLRRTADLYGDADVADLVSHQAIRRPITVEEMAACITVCCSPAGVVLNGGVVHADGGYPA